ncbi:MAG: hypothetical protein LUI06_06095 [Ruminococcus sp.]|nr:hypothetical protein [Ruminococcus sp.]
MGMIFERDDNGDPEDLAHVIDKLMADGSGHLYVDLDNLEDGITFTTTNTTDCGKTGACAQPTELLDDEPDEEEE